MERRNVTRISDLVNTNFHFLWTAPSAHDISRLSENKQCVEIVRYFFGEVEKLSEEDYSQDRIKTMLQEYARKGGIKFKTVMTILRMALSGLEEGPAVSEMCMVLGRNVVMRKLNYSLGLMDKYDL